MGKRKIDDRYYPIERILKKRIVKGKVEYYIKWMDYSHRHNSLQPKSNIRRIHPVRSENAVQVPSKIILRFENGMCLVKWPNGKTSMMQLSTREAYRVIVNGSID